MSLAWVIEGAWSDPAAPQYWAGSSLWMGDHMCAIRFAREHDARQAASAMLDGMNIRICEHIWSDETYDAPKAYSVREALEETVARYRYAIDWIAADSWDSCSEGQDRLAWARQHDLGQLSPAEMSDLAAKYLADRAELKPKRKRKAQS